MEALFIGIDGGGSRTRAVVLDGEGGELARAEGSAALADPDHPERAAESLGELARLAARDASLDLPWTSLWAGLTGFNRETIRSSVELELKRLGLARRVHVGTDAEACFHAAFGHGAGILLSAGTGSVAVGRNEMGLQARIGGWGTPTGEEGSSYAIGLAGLRRAMEEGGQETRLSRLMLTHLWLDAPEDLSSWASRAHRLEIAGLAPVVVEAARRGDTPAGEILLKAVDDLVGHVLTIVTNLGPWETLPRVALAGGLLGREGPLRNAVDVALSAHDLNVLPYSPDTALGAAGMARELALQAVS